MSSSKRVEREAKSGKGKKKSIWEEILADVSKGAQVPDSHLIVLGSKNAGKRTLLTSLNQRLTKNESGKKSKKLQADPHIGSAYSMVDYGYLPVRDTSDPETEENIAVLSTWILDNPLYKEHLKRLYKPEYLVHTIGVIVLNCDEPWNVAKELRLWIGVLMELLEDLMKDLPLETQDTMKNKIITHVKNYEAPSVDAEDEFKQRNALENAGLKDELPLGEGVLEVKLGIPLVILCTKSDVIQSNDKGIFIDQALDVLCKHIRTTALSYGAAVLFVSEKSQTNIDLFYHYLVHRLYSFPFMYKPLLEEKNRVFIPSGFDSITLIDETSKSAGEMLLEEAFKSPPQNKEAAKEEIKCEEFGTVLLQWMHQFNKLPSETSTRITAGIASKAQNVKEFWKIVKGADKTQSTVPKYSLAERLSTAQPIGAVPAKEEAKKST